MVKLHVALWSSMDVDRTEQKDLGRRAGGQGLRDRLSALDVCDLILSQADILLEECSQVRIRLRIGGPGGSGNQDQQSTGAHSTSNHGICFYIFHFPHRRSRV